MYRGISFRAWSLGEIEEYLSELIGVYGSYAEKIKRVYLVGADPFVISAKSLLERVELIKKYLPNVDVVSMYARTDNIARNRGGKDRGLEVAEVTAALENEIKPAKILVNTMSAFVGTELDDEIKTGEFVPAGEKEILQEEHFFLKGLELPNTYFWAIHPLDSVGVEGILKTE